MRSKKSNAASLEKKRIWFLQIGFVTAFAITLVSFEWQKPINNQLSDEQFTTTFAILEPELAPLHIPKLPKVVPPKINPDHPIKIVEELTPEFDPIDIDPMDEFVDDPIIEDIPDLPETTTETPPLPFIAYGDMPYYSDCFAADKLIQKECTDQKIINLLKTEVSYPKICREQGIQGTVWVSFIVDKQGLPTDIKISRSVHPAIDKEVIDAVKQLPQFIAGNQRGQKVEVQYDLPVSFKLKN